MQRAEMEELRQRDANLTALQAIGPRKKPRLEGDTTTTSTVRKIIKLKFLILMNFSTTTKKLDWRNRIWCNRQSTRSTSTSYQTCQSERHDFLFGTRARNV